MIQIEARHWKDSTNGDDISRWKKSQSRLMRANKKLLNLVDFGMLPRTEIDNGKKSRVEILIEVIQ